MSVCCVSSGEINNVLGFIYFNRVAIIGHGMRHASLRELAQQFVADNKAAFEARYQGRHKYTAPKLNWVSNSFPQFCPSIAATKVAAEHLQYNVEDGMTNDLCKLVIDWCDALDV